MQPFLALALLTLTTATYAQTGPVKVEVQRTAGRYELRRAAVLHQGR